VKFRVIGTLTSYLIPSVLAAFLLHAYEEVRSISNPPADVCLGGGFEIGVSAAAIMKRFEQISDEDLNKKIN
jgi:hypothetical protein